MSAGWRGWNSGTITNSYSTGTVSGTNFVGGLVGYNGDTITDSYWDKETSGQDTSDGGTGLTTAEMMQLASFSGWSIASTGGSSATWRIYEGYTYPLLRSFLTPLTVTADNVTKTYDGTAWNGELQNVNYSGADTSKIFNRNTPYGAGSGKNVGSYTPQLYSSQQGYDISYANGVLTITPAALTITADDKTKVYGDANPALTASYSGLKGTDTSSVVSGLNLTTAATTGSNVGSYIITAAGGTATNYTITFVNGVLTITRAPSVLDKYQIMDTEDITDIKNFNDTIVLTGASVPELWTAEAVYEIEPTVFGYQPPKEEEDEDEKIKRQKRE